MAQKDTQPQGFKRWLPWVPVAVIVVQSLTGDAVQAYQVDELQGKVETLEEVQVQQAVTENEIKHIKEDVENLDDTMGDLNDKMDLILQRLGAQ